MRQIHNRLGDLEIQWRPVLIPVLTGIDEQGEETYLNSMTGEITMIPPRNFVIIG